MEYDSQASAAAYWICAYVSSRFSQLLMVVRLFFLYGTPRTISVRLARPVFFRAGFFNVETASVVSSTSPAQFRLKSFLSLFVSAYTIHTTNDKIASFTRFLILEGFYASTGFD